METHGDVKLSELLRKLKGDRVYKCPKCGGSGIVTVCVRPESWGYWDAEYANRDCDVCGGHGYTSREIRPITRTEVIGYG